MIKWTDGTVFINDLTYHEVFLSVGAHSCILIVHTRPPRYIYLVRDRPAKLGSSTSPFGLMNIYESTPPHSLVWENNIPFVHVRILIVPIEDIIMATNLNDFYYPVRGPNVCLKVDPMRGGSPAISYINPNPKDDAVGCGEFRRLIKNNFEIDPWPAIVDKVHFRNSISFLRLLYSGSVRIERIADKDHRPETNASGEYPKSRHQPLRKGILREKPTVKWANPKMGIAWILILLSAMGVVGFAIAGALSWATEPRERPNEKEKGDRNPGD